MRVEIRGVIYESVPAAAEALGVSKWAVYEGLKKGNPDGVGLGTGNHNGHNGGSPKKPVSFFGGKLTFKSMAEAGRELGCDKSQIRLILMGKTGPMAREKLNLRAMRYLSKMNRSSRA